MKDISTNIQNFISKITISKIIIIIIIIIAVIIIYKQISKIVKDIKNPDSVANANKDVVESELTYSKTQYSSWADTIYSCFYTGLFGSTEDEDTIISVFKNMKTNSDMYQLIIAFGKRYVSTFLPFSWDEQDLPVFVSKFMTSSEISEINNIISSNGLTFTF